MYREKKMWGQDPTVVVRSKPGTFNSPLKWKDPKMIFVCSWSDFFHEGADPWRDEAWEVILATQHHTYQILTKRPERISANLPRNWGAGWPNVWLGVSAEDQENANKRLPLLMETPASVRFVSVEPILGPVDLSLWMYDSFQDEPLDWVIVGDESGPGRRPGEIGWVCDIREQCETSGASFFFKQWNGEKMPELAGKTWAELPTRRQQ